MSQVPKEPVQIVKTDKDSIVCELCDKIFDNRVQKYNHKRFQHTVTTEILKCEYCAMECHDMMELCIHISSKHKEMFQKKPELGTSCEICYDVFNSNEQVTKHMNEKHSPDSFYEKLVEDISGLCRVCGGSFSPSEMVEHFQIHKAQSSNSGTTAGTAKCDKEEKVNTVNQTLNTLPTIGEDNDVEVKQSIVKTEEFEDYVKTTHDETNPKLITLQGRSSEFLEARRVIARIMRRSSLQKNYLIINETKFKVKNLQNKMYSTEAVVETIDKNNIKGQSKITIYKDNKKKAGKKDQTIMLSKKARNDSENVKILSENVVQYLVEGLIRKELTEADIKLDGGNETVQQNPNEQECDICKRKFPTKQGCSIHKSKKHVPKQQSTENLAQIQLVSSLDKHETRFVCNLCGEVRGSELTLKAHVELMHEKGLKRTLSEMRTQPSIVRYTCKKCEVTFNCENDLQTHVAKHTTSPPHKKQKSEIQELPAVEEMDHDSIEAEADVIKQKRCNRSYGLGNTSD